MPDENTKIWQYKENAEEIFPTGSVQFGAEDQVLDAIRSLTQKDEEDNSFSMEQTAEALQQDLELNNGPETHYGDHQQFSVEVKDPEELAFLFY